MTTIEYATARLGVWRNRVQLLQVVLSVLAFPFVLAGWTAGTAVVAYHGAVAAVRTGYADVRRQRAD